ncbi:peptide chain release factor 2 [Lactiplantibacillus plantarum]|uniref:peptide chain release factor 2 n=1 Tax=Lactiplantibacillus plantarum TaxID=1590 RepID=UPI000C716D3E|nr:peptide chain release factor 2 [Lactiplantibacillus plantarum]MDE4414743.1 peptide chain release factor 2 [Lactiplantibacillus plantarum]MDE4418821.1 peptide chain release factor 2 [Lactiplantibacillus plantarum]MDE4419724.1 peptide chain release factor 2 [Lactiplantibacillus plantarum]MDE4422938.1 peptide chain release factor 2 [Lactiplantibacillus plantarum]MDE4427838.1 peptide chain release factor 2 [Lactiplantibacillus plantarum]
MELSEYKHLIEEMQSAVDDFRGSLDLDALNESIQENEARMAEPGFWDDQAAAQKVIDENNVLKGKYDTFKQLADEVGDLAVAYELLSEEPDAEMQAEFETDFQHAEHDLQQYRLNLLLDGPYDRNNAILEIHPGAGGTESQDWGAMLLRMYTRWAASHNFKVETVDYQAGDEAGIKSVTLLISGHNAYGYLRSEKGVHRLVRISPFDAAGRRHTSFASVDVMPELDDTVDVDIRPEDLKIDVYRASGAGGQHVNKTSSAVRITHVPTGIVVASQAQRSQLQNRQTALNMLRAKLYEREEEKKAKERAAIQGEQMDIGWGSQIRSYVFHPYTMVKDHRTNYESHHGQAVMDGDLDPFMDAYLQWKLAQRNPQ